MASDRGLEDRLRAIFATIGGLGDDFAVDADLQRELGLSSFRLVEVLLEIERQLDRPITEDEFANLRTLRDYLVLLG